MKSDCYFEECRNCINRKYNDDLICCVSNRLALAWHKMLVELKLANGNKYCNYFEKE
jgi:hypothetical protein